MPLAPGADDSGLRTSTPGAGLTAGRVTALLVLAPAIGMFFGGTAFAVLCAAGAALAAARVRAAGLWWVLPLAPVAIWTLCVGREVFDASGGGGRQDVAVAQGMIDAFPPMLLTLLATVAVALARRFARGRSARG